MAEDRGVRVLDRLEQTVGHLTAFLVELGVNAGDDKVHLREDLVGEVEVALAEDIDLNSGEDLDAFHAIADFANTLDVYEGALVVEAIGEGQVLRVIGDGDVLV